MRSQVGGINRLCVRAVTHGVLTQLHCTFSIRIHMDNHQSIGEAIERIGLTKLAEALGESTQTVSNWRSRGVPANRCARFSHVTGIPRPALRSEDWFDFWPELVGTEGAPAVASAMAAEPARQAGCSCGTWEMSDPDVTPVAATAPVPDAAEPDAAVSAAPPSSAFAQGGRREEDHAGSDFGALDTNGETLAAEIDAQARLLGEEGDDAI